MSGRRDARGVHMEAEDGDDEKEEEIGMPRDVGMAGRGANQSASGATPGNPGGDCPQEGPQRQGVYTMLTPNAEKHQRLKTRAAEEEAALDRLRSERRAVGVRITPSHVGEYCGLCKHLSEGEVRKNQQLTTSRAKIQARMDREERERCRRAQDEAEFQKKKDIQRQKAIEAESRHKQRDAQRRRSFAMDHSRTNEHFLNKVEWSSQKDTAKGPQADTAMARSKFRDYRDSQRKEEEEAHRLKKETQRRKAEDLEEKKKAEENKRARQLQMDHRRANQAFLDRLEGRRSGETADIPQCEGTWHEESSTPPFKDGDNIGVWRSSGADPRPLDSFSSRNDAASSDITQLRDKFPWYNEQALKQILDDCCGDISRVCSLLSE
ncbi:epithelial-stromal interaction protein 1-like [Lethenteron reissneri]|uniref:epithelial-stromal interaction protein 1-like n=1 Tax=Lethenteron reissneri TaxID=7753 RepID=UPI002AB7EBC3|nr:epithelial-stromal interaction protein 1-like [Lethenteron reissneri]